MEEDFNPEDWEAWIDGFGKRWLVHAEAVCAKPCPIHAPSNHPLKDAKQLFRSDRGIMERVCSHGVGHSDPDDLRVQTDEYERVHGCCQDRCCEERDDGKAAQES